MEQLLLMLTYTFNHDEWMDLKVVVDLDNDWATYYHDDVEMIGYQWSLGCFGTPGLVQFGGVDIFGGANAATTDTPLFYFDDVQLSLANAEPSDELTGYNVYLDGALQDYTTALTYQYTGLVPNTDYIAGVSAVYDDPGESEIVEEPFTFLPSPTDPPINFTATLADYNDVYLEWEPPVVTPEVLSVLPRTKGIENSRNSRMLLGYKVYRDGTEIAEILDPNQLTYDDLCLDGGTYEYWVTAIYDEGESDPSNAEEVTVILYAPQNFMAIVQGINNVFLTWDAPAERTLDWYNIYRNGEFMADVTSTFYLDINVPAGTYVYNVTAVYCGGWESVFSNNGEVTVDVGDPPLPLVTELNGNYPNPFNPETSIKFALKEAGNVRIDVFNLKGQHVRTVVNDHLKAAYHSVVWDGKDTNGINVSSGVYFYKMDTGEYTSIKKMILMK